MASASSPVSLSLTEDVRQEMLDFFRTADRDTLYSIVRAATLKADLGAGLMEVLRHDVLPFIDKEHTGLETSSIREKARKLIKRWGVKTLPVEEQENKGNTTPEGGVTDASSGEKDASKPTPERLSLTPLRRTTDDGVPPPSLDRSLPDQVVPRISKERKLGEPIKSVEDVAPHTPVASSSRVHKTKTPPPGHTTRATRNQEDQTEVAISPEHVASPALRSSTAGDVAKSPHQDHAGTGKEVRGHAGPSNLAIEGNRAGPSKQTTNVTHEVIDLTAVSDEDEGLEVEVIHPQNPVANVVRAAPPPAPAAPKRHTKGMLRLPRKPDPVAERRATLRSATRARTQGPSRT
ncbi:hypothetical protein BDW22DRAFT_1353417 [Trametopsis cervina]|nr:hypothetical protein BDW22DRAFT_1353417 [Trametopsis cervina]